MKMTGRFLDAVILIFILSGFVFFKSGVDKSRLNVPPETKRAEALLLSPEILQVVSGEFKGLIADYLLLKASVFLGGHEETSHGDWKTLAIIFEQSLGLDPKFSDTAQYIQAFLPWKRGLETDTIELLKKSKEARYWDWEPPYFIGFNYFYFLKNYKLASDYFMEAVKIPGAPPIVGTLGARISRREGMTENAIYMLNMLYERAVDDLTKEILSKRIEAYLGVLILEKAVLHFRSKFGKLPDRLPHLKDSGIIQKLPVNPFGETFYYENQTGYIGFDDIRP